MSSRSRPGPSPDPRIGTPRARTEPLRIGCFAAFWGDTKFAIRDILDGAEVDYLVADYLSEITMALLARARAKDPEGGFIADFIATIKPVLPEIAQRGIKVVCNAGALNPAAAARAVRAACVEAGVSLTVAAVEGDDLMPRAEELAGSRDMFTGAVLPSRPGSMNVRLRDHAIVLKGNSRPPRGECRARGS